MERIVEICRRYEYVLLCFAVILRVFLTPVRSSQPAFYPIYSLTYSLLVIAASAMIATVSAYELSQWKEYQSRRIWNIFMLTLFTILLISTLAAIPE